jgi:uroporphyrinogen decarboxylase
MLSKDRCVIALNHQEPDRVPLALWGGPYGLVDPLYKALLSELNLGDPLPPIRKGHTVNHMDDRVLEALGVDTRMIWPGASPSSPTHVEAENGLIFDDFGQPWRRTHPYYSATDGLLKNAHSVEEISTLVKWPDPDNERWVHGVSERANLLKNSEYFIVGRMVVSHGPFQMACDLRSMENFMMDMIVNPEFAECLLDRVTDIICGLTRNYIEASAGVMDMIELPGDDYAANDNLVFSPMLFRQMIRPRIEKIIACIREIQPNIKIMLHSDGAVGKLIPDFIEMGIDILHPLEPVQGMDPAEMKAKYGKSISFLGGVDISHAMNGTLKDVQDDVDRCLKDLAPGGGYILAPCNHLQEDVPAQNVVKLFSYAKDKGVYH